MSKELDRRFAAEATAAYLANGGKITMCPAGKSTGAFNAAVSGQPMTRGKLEAK